MSLQIRVLVEVSDSSGGDTYIRLDHTETVMPATGEDRPDDYMELVEAVLARMDADITKRAGEQLAQVARVIGDDAT